MILEQRGNQIKRRLTEEEKAVEFMQSRRELIPIFVIGAVIYAGLIAMFVLIIGGVQ